MQQIVCLVLKATHSRTLIVLGLAYRTGTGPSELPLGVFCTGGLWDHDLCCVGVGLQEWHARQVWK